MPPQARQPPAGIEKMSPAMLEGYAGAKVLVEGFNRAGKNLTRSGLQAALESIRSMDIGGMDLSYSPSNHTGLTYAELSIVGADGNFRR